MARTARPLGHCSRCRRAYWKGADDFDRWNGQTSRGLLVALVCPGCQTGQVHLEAEVKEATLDYANATQDAFGRTRVLPLTGEHGPGAAGAQHG